MINWVVCVTGIPEASVILLQAEKEYPDSAIFMYFKGRVLSLQVLDHVTGCGIHVLSW